MSILSQKEKLRYHRHLILDEIGDTGQVLIKEARVLVVGAGGLGCPLIQYLTATGVGYISIADDDVVDISNLQRQVFYGTNDLGKHKAIMAAKLMRATNSNIDIREIVTRVSYSNARKLISDHDVIVDCTDNLTARYVLSDACVLENRPLVHASVYKTQGQLTVLNYQGGPSYRCIFPKPESVPTNTEQIIGIYSVLPGIIGLMQANEVLKVIIGVGNVLSGRMLIYHAFNQEFNFLAFKKNPDNFVSENILKNF